MLVYAAGSVAAWIAVGLCIFVVTLPYLLRNGRLGIYVEHGVRSASPARGRTVRLRSGRAASIPSRSYMRRLWPHFWAAYLAGGLTIVHVGTVMPAMRRANGAGVFCATGAFFLLGFEIILGLSLREGGGRGRAFLRKIHFWVGVCFVCLLTAHLWLDG